MEPVGETVLNVINPNLILCMQPISNDFNCLLVKNIKNDFNCLLGLSTIQELNLITVNLHPAA